MWKSVQDNYEKSFQKVVHDNAMLIIGFLIFCSLLGLFWAWKLASANKKNNKKSKYAKYANENNDDPKDKDYEPSDDNHGSDDEDGEQVKLRRSPRLAAARKRRTRKAQ